MNSSANQSTLDKDNESLLKRIDNFAENIQKSIVGSTQNDLLKLLKIGAQGIKEGVKIAIKGPAYLYKKFSKQYEELKPIAEELSTVLPHLDGERKEDMEFVDQFPTMPEIEKDEYKKEIKKGYDMVERETIPTETRLGQLRDIIKKIKELAFGDEDPESYIFSIDFSLIRNKEEEILSDTFTEKRMDIIIAMRTYSVVKKTIKEYKKEIEQKYGVKN